MPRSAHAAPDMVRIPALGSGNRVHCQVTSAWGVRCVLSITDLASAKIKEVLEQNNRQGAALRVWVRGMSCSGPAYGMSLEQEPRPDDTIEELDGLRVFIDPVSAPYVEGAQIDYVDSLMGQGFQITNPNVQSSGGCGSGCSCGH
jgi:iron-sulfur cluster assembly protein